LFSVDGGHTAEATFNDISLAAASIPEGGIMILDDYFNSAWPGVSEGTCRYMAAQMGTLQPDAIGFNKFFFTLGVEAAQAYRRRLFERRPQAKLSRVFDREVLCFEAPTTIRQLIAASRRWQSIRDTRLGRVLRSGARRWV
jgi:hypothetical protein